MRYHRVPYRTLPVKRRAGRLCFSSTSPASGLPGESPPTANRHSVRFRCIVSTRLGIPPLASPVAFSLIPYIFPATGQPLRLSRRSKLLLGQQPVLLR